MKKMKLFCFPFAGGTAYYYNKFKSMLNEKIILIPVELDGRGAKFNISPKTTINDVIESIYYDVISQFDERPYMFFGHSMGSLIAYELYYKFSENNIKLPIHIFFSGCRAPHLMKYRESSYLKDDKEFLEVIRRNGGTPEQFFKHQNLIDLFLPILKADYQVVDTYKFTSNREKMKCNITVLKGNTDFEGGYDGLDWSSYSQGQFQEYVFEGDHFFINNYMTDIAQLLNKYTEIYLD